MVIKVNSLSDQVYISLKIFEKGEPLRFLHNCGKGHSIKPDEPNTAIY